MCRLTLILLIIASISSVFSEEGLHSFYFNDIVPTIIPKAPANLLNVTFGKNVTVLEGNVLKLEDIVFKPTIEWKDVDPTKNYTLIEFDPDVTSRSSNNSLSFLHWMKVNIPGSNLEGGDTVSFFLNSLTPPGTGYHRYTFLLYEQNTYLQVDQVLQQTIFRLNFCPQTFADNNNLGALVAGNFYLAGTAKDVTAILGFLFT